LPKKTIRAIVEGGNDYLIEVKGNQPNLLKQIKINISKSTSIDSYKKEERNRGRLEKRAVDIYDKLTGIDPEWIGLNRIIRIVRSGIRFNKEYYEEHYLISSLLTSDAKSMAKKIRAHWGIENKLHFVKDVNMNEDNSRIKAGQGAENLSLVKNMAINVYRHNGYQSLKYATIQFTNKIVKQLELCSNTYMKIKL
jgi:predicted transposase YbfD/YdcC